MAQSTATVLVQRNKCASCNTQHSSQHPFSVRHTRPRCKETNKARHHFSWGRRDTLTALRRAPHCRLAAQTADRRVGQPTRGAKDAEGLALPAPSALRSAQATAAQAHLLGRRAAGRALELGSAALQLRRDNKSVFVRPSNPEHSQNHGTQRHPERKRERNSPRAASPNLWTGGPENLQILIKHVAYAQSKAAGHKTPRSQSDGRCCAAQRSPMLT